MRYNPDQKAEAIARIAEVGVPQTSQEMGISIQTLYTWQRKMKDADSSTFEPMPAKTASVETKSIDDEVRQIILNDKTLLSTIERLEATVAELEKENAELRRSNIHMRNMIIASLPQG